MALRKIVHIDEDKCNGCGLCIPTCHEGAIQIIDGKARLVAEKLCDGLGDCLGECPQGAITIVEREAEEYDAEAVERHVSSLQGGCPGSRSMTLRPSNEGRDKTAAAADVELRIKPQLGQWPVQLALVPEKAPYFNGKELLVTADCVPFAYANYHLDWLQGRSVVVGCPKLDNLQLYLQKLTRIIQNNDITGITVLRMEVPCCYGLAAAVEQAVATAGKDISVRNVIIGIKGEAGVQK